MKEDFLEEEKNEKEVERIPAPSKSGKKPKKRITLRWWHGAIALFLTMISFLSGYLVSYNSFDSQIYTLLAVKKKIQENYYKDVSDEEFYDAVFDGINENLLDRYSGYMSAKEFLSNVDEMMGNRSGLGLAFVGENSLRVARVCGNSPAEEAGIVAGETVLGIGEGAEAITACATFEKFSALLAEYEEGETFFLQMEAPSGETRVIALAKAEYRENYVFYRTSTEAYACVGERADKLAKRGEPLTCLDENTAYIRLIEFIGDAEEQFYLAMEQFKADGKKNLVLDLRGNGGGYLTTMQAIARYFCKTAEETLPVVAVADFGDREESYRAYGNVYDEYFQEDSRICVLADNGTASAAECLIGCMLDYETISYGDICLAERDGVAKTYGKGIMQETYIVNLFKLNALKLTTAEIKWPLTKQSIHSRGVLETDGTAIVEENIDYEAETVAAIAALWQ